MGAMYLFGRCAGLFSALHAARLGPPPERCPNTQAGPILVYTCAHLRRRTATASDNLPIAFSIPLLLHGGWVVGFLIVYRPGPHLPHVGCELGRRAPAAARAGAPQLQHAPALCRL